MGGLIVYFGLIAILFILLIASVIRSRNAIKENKIKQDNYLRKKGVTYSKVLEWYPRFKGNLFRVIVDDKKRYVYVSKGINPKDFDRIPYSEILDYQLVLNNKVESGLGGAIVGGILAGGVGAIIGNKIASKSYVYTLEAVIYRDNISKPRYVFDFVKKANGGKAKITDPHMQSALAFAEDLNSIIKSVKAKSGRM